MSAASVARHELAGRADDGEVALRSRGSPAARHHPQPQRGVDRRAAQPAAAVRGLDRVHRDPRVAQRGAAEHRVQRVEQRRVAAPVAGQRGVPVGGLGGRRGS